MFEITLNLLAGLVLLTLGAEWLVRGASQLALIARISPLVIGLTVVAFGTSAPELTVSVMASFTGDSEVGLGNVVGSNIFNVLFILGISAIIVPLTVQSQLLKFDVPLLVFISIAAWVMGIDGRIGAVDGAILVAGFFAYTIWTVRVSRKETASGLAAEDAESPVDGISGTTNLWMSVVLSAVGLGLLVFGSKLFVDGAVNAATMMGISKLVIGLTIVAAGTSLPEVFTSIVAAIKGERDIAVGNVIGSNLFNLLSVLGFSGLASDLAGFGGIVVPASALRFDLVVMIAAAIVCLPIFFTGHVISRKEGGLLLFYQFLYTGWLLISASRQDTDPTMPLFTLSIVAVLTLGILMFETKRHRGDMEIVTK